MIELTSPVIAKKKRRVHRNRRRTSFTFGEKTEELIKQIMQEEDIDSVSGAIEYLATFYEKSQGGIVARFATARERARVSAEARRHGRTPGEYLADLARRAIGL